MRKKPLFALLAGTIAAVVSVLSLFQSCSSESSRDQSLLMSSNPAEPQSAISCYNAAIKACQFFGNHNPGLTSEKIKFCTENGGAALQTCPEENFMASCYYSRNDIKYYFYTGYPHSVKDDCLEKEGLFSTEYSAQAE